MGEFEFKDIVDIPGLSRTEKPLRDSEERYRRLFETAQDAILIIDAETGKIIDANPFLVNLLGFTKKEVFGKKLWQIGAFTDISESKVAFEELQQKGYIRYEDLPLKTKDGRLIEVEFVSNVYSVDGKKVIQCNVRDITERKKAEKILESQHALLTALINSPRDIIIFAIDKNYRYITFNEKHREEMNRIWKTDIENGINLLDCMQLPDLQVLAKKSIDRALKGESFSEIQYQPVQNIYYEFNWSPIWQHDKITGVTAFIKDITERKLMEEQMRQMQKLEGLGTLAGGIAHDFNNILGIILAYITNIKRFKDDTKKLEIAIDTVTSTVQRGKDLVRQILTFARKTETKFDPVNINDIIMEIVTMMLETFPRVLTCKQNFGEDIPFINGDRSQLLQAILNLCMNARDAMPNNGELTINTYMVTGLSLRNLHPDAPASSYVCIEVNDTGEGMSEETRKHIFEPFFTTKEKEKGTGLGLAVVFGVVQTHGGFIDVESELGKGTTFRIYLPTSQTVKLTGIEAEEITEDIKGGTETLLIVEDEVCLMEPLLTVLVESGYTILSADEGLAAVKIYEEHQNEIALVLTDLGLPKITGMDVCKQIKQVNPDARIIVTTGFLDPGMKSEFLKIDVQNFLFKPYRFDNVLKTVRKVLDEKFSIS